MEFEEYWKILSKRWLYIFTITLITVLVSAILSYFVIKPIYKSDISVIIGKVSNGTNSSQEASYNELVAYQMLVKTYSELVKSRTIAEDTIKNLKLDIKPEELQKMILVSLKSDTEFLTISVKSKNAEQAMLIANQLSKSLKEIGIEVKKMDNVQILDPAQLPTVPDSPKPMLNIAVAFLLGLVISVGLAFLLNYLDDTIKTQEDIVKLLGVPVIGLIPYESEVK